MTRLPVLTALIAATTVAPALAELPDTGQASWYGEAWSGRRTSSGAAFDPRAMTAASPYLPLGTRVRVTSHDTGASVVVTVNDRQAARGNRVIDLSRGAAARIGLVRQGRGDVTLTDPDDEPVEVAEASGRDAAPDMPGPGRRHGARRARNEN